MSKLEAVTQYNSSEAGTCS